MTAPSIVAIVAERHVEGAVTAKQAVETLADMAGISQCRAALLIVDYERDMFGEGCERWTPRQTGGAS